MTSGTLFRNVAALTIVAGLVFGACGDPSGTPAVNPGGGGSSISDGPPDGPVSSTPSPGDDKPGPFKPTFIRPRPGMADLHPMQWQKAKVSKNGRSVTIHFYIGVEPCYVLDHIDVKYGARAVTITLYQGHDRDAGDNVACIELAMAAAVRLQLDEPLGDRRIVDGAK